MHRIPHAHSQQADSDKHSSSSARRAQRCLRGCFFVVKRPDALLQPDPQLCAFCVGQREAVVDLAFQLANLFPDAANFLGVGPAAGHLRLAGVKSFRFPECRHLVGQGGGSQLAPVAA